MSRTFVHSTGFLTDCLSIASAPVCADACADIETRLVHPDYNDEPFAFMLGETAITVSGPQEAESFHSAFANKVATTGKDA